MIFDTLQATFSENQAITATAISENVMDLGELGTVPYERAALVANLGAGTEIPLLVQVTEDFAGLTSLTVSFETSAAAGLTAATVLYRSGAIPLATLKAGYRLPIRWLPDADLQRYVGLRYRVGDPNATAGRITAALTMGVNT